MPDEPDHADDTVEQQVAMISDTDNTAPADVEQPQEMPADDEMIESI